VVYTPAGKNAADADAQRARQEKTSTAVVIAQDAGLQIVTGEERRTLDRWRHHLLNLYRLTGQ